MSQSSVAVLAPGLLTEYLSWTRSQRILDRLMAEILPDAHRKQVKAALENALMQAFLEEKYASEDLFSLLKATHQIRQGFLAVGMADLPELADARVLALIREASSDRKLDPALHILPDLLWNRDQIRLGAFSLTRNAYIDKALDHVVAKHGEAQGLSLLLTAALRYASTYAETRHIGPPQRVYDDFYRWGVRNEGFASPFNARLLGKPEAQFYSLFPDTDAPFGSGGSFFQLDGPENPGHWCLDPPFLPETMQQVDRYIADWRTKYPETAILLIVPASHRPAYQPEETVLLQAGTHHYEGLAGTMQPLPVDVAIHRYGDLPGFSAEAIREGYLP